MRWRDPVIIRNQVDESNDVDRAGLSKDLMGALLGREAHTVAALIDYKVMPFLIDLEKLVTLTWPDDEDEGNRYAWSVRDHDKWNSSAAGLALLARLLTRLSHVTVHPESNHHMNRGMQKLVDQLLPEFVQQWQTGFVMSGARKRWTREQIQQRMDDKALTSSSNSPYPQVDDLMPSFGDVMLWAVMANELEIAKTLWRKVSQREGNAHVHAHTHKARACRVNIKTCRSFRRILYVCD